MHRLLRFWRRPQRRLIALHGATPSAGALNDSRTTGPRQARRDRQEVRRWTLRTTPCNSEVRQQWLAWVQDVELVQTDDNRSGGPPLALVQGPESDGRVRRDGLELGCADQRRPAQRTTPTAPRRGSTCVGRRVGAGRCSVMAEFRVTGWSWVEGVDLATESSSWSWVGDRWTDPAVLKAPQPMASTARVGELETWWVGWTTGPILLKPFDVELKLGRLDQWTDPAEAVQRLDRDAVLELGRLDQWSCSRPRQSCCAAAG